MKRLLVCLLITIAACSPTKPPTPPDPTQPAPTPDTGIPECLQIPNSGRANAEVLELAAPVGLPTGEAWYKATLSAGTYRATFNNLFDYRGFGFFVYKPGEVAPLDSIYERDYESFLDFEFELEEGDNTVFRLTHIGPLDTCENYVFTLVKLRE